MRVVAVPTTISPEDAEMYPRLLLFATAQSAFPISLQNLSRISVSGFLDCQGAISQIIAIILTLSDIAETESRRGVMQLRVLIRWRQLAIGQFLLARKPI